MKDPAIESLSNILVELFNQDETLVESDTEGQAMMILRLMLRRVKLIFFGSFPGCMRRENHPFLDFINTIMFFSLAYFPIAHTANK